MKETTGLIFTSIIPALLSILCIVIEGMFPGHLYALKGIGVVVAYMLIVALPVTIKMVGKGNIEYIRLPTWR